ncbi:MAG: hypothetical protein AABX88_00745 [Nanoarchaeota archaeon]
MVSISLIGWSIGIVGSLIGIVGGIHFFLGLRDMNEVIKSHAIYIFISGLIWTMYNAFMIFFALMRLDIKNDLWAIVPISYAVTSILFLVGTINLLKFLKDKKLTKK